MYGSGLVKGLGVTFKHWFSREFTEQYPEDRPNLPPATHYFFNFDKEACICCNMCVTACPNKVITLTCEKNEDNKRVCVGYKMELSYCLMCGLCTDICPTHALTNAPTFELGIYHRENSDYEFTSDRPGQINDKFNALQEAYWSERKTPYPVGPPVPYVAPKKEGR